MDTFGNVGDTFVGGLLGPGAMYLTLFVLLVSFLFLFLRPKHRPLHVLVKQPNIKVLGVNIFPFISLMFQLLPEGVRRSSLMKQAAPKPDKPIRDRHDLVGDSPYIITELVAGKVWQVAYDIESFFYTLPAGKKDSAVMGMDPRSKELEQQVMTAAGQFGPEVVEVAKEDLKTARFWFAKDKLDNEEVVKLGLFRLNSFVVKLDSGSLLLYSPNRVREEHGFRAWLDSLGKVDWVVLGSSAHTLSMPQVLKTYPEAKVVGPETAEAKLQHCGALVRGKFDFVTSKTGDLKRAQEVLRGEGVELTCVEGDLNGAVLVVAHSLMLECDLLYGHHDGEGFLMTDKEGFRSMRPEDWGNRIFKFNLLTKPASPNGFLPPYRFMMMDPSSLGAMVGLEKPASDGSTCTKMARSLRAALSLQFSSVAGVHLERMDREDFRKSIDAAWNWLDGRSLLSLDDADRS